MSEPQPAFRFGRGEWVTLAAIAVLGLATVPQPFAWDQAMFTLGAKKLAAGAVLYRDYWDPKQPALFAFYWLGGRLFGFTETGVHLFELLYLLGFAAVLMAIVGGRAGAAAGRAAALLSVGLFFATCSDALHAQIECVAGLPLLLALEGAVRADEQPERAPRWLFLSGVAGGVALLFKLLLLPILIAFWLVPMWALWKRGFRPALRGAIALKLGAALPLIACALYFAAHGALGLAAWTSFVYPIGVMRAAHEPRMRTLLKSALWFARYWAPVMGAATVGLAGAYSRRGDRFALGMFLWLASGALVLLVQRLSYWPYHFFIFLVPLAYFAAMALPRLAALVAAVVPGNAGVRGGASVALAALVFLPALALWLPQAASLARDGFALSPASLQRQLERESVGGVYAKVRAEVAFLSEPGARPGAIWVVGNPLYYWLSSRDQAVPRNGGSFIQFASEREWQGITASLAAARPAYIYVHDDYGAFLTQQLNRDSSFLALLDRDFTPTRHSSHGTWYEPRAAAATKEDRP